MMTNTFINDIQRNLASTYELQQQISTGKKVLNPSDDPIGASRTLDYRQIIDQSEQYSNNVDDADSIASNIDGVLSSIEDIMMRLRDLAVDASNEAPENQQNRDAIADEIDSLINELVFQSNQKFNGKSLFSGYKSSTTPFVAKNYVDFVYGTTAAPAANLTIDMPTTANGSKSEAILDLDSVKGVYVVDDQGNRTAVDVVSVDPDPVDGKLTRLTVDTLTPGLNINSTDRIIIEFDRVVSVEYQGDTGTREIEISNSSRVGVSYAGASASSSGQTSVFGTYNPEGTGSASVEAFQELMDLRDRIYKYESDSGTTIEDIMQGIDDIDDIRENITTIRSEQGGRVNRLELAKNRLENIIINTEELRSSYEDVDMAEAITEYTLLQNVYQASLAVGGSIIQTTLLDYLS